jgi:hypothetical protein
VGNHGNGSNGNATWDGHRYDAEFYLPKGLCERSDYVAYGTSGTQLFDGSDGCSWSFSSALTISLIFCAEASNPLRVAAFFDGPLP